MCGGQVDISTRRWQIITDGWHPSTCAALASDDRSLSSIHTLYDLQQVSRDQMLLLEKNLVIRRRRTDLHLRVASREVNDVPSLHHSSRDHDRLCGIAST